MDDPFQEDISWNIFIHQYYWAFVVILLFFFFVIGLLLWYMRRCSTQPKYQLLYYLPFSIDKNQKMNFYCMHFRQKQKETVPEKPEMNVRRTPKFTNNARSFDIQSLAKEHALAYFQKPWDYYLKNDEARAKPSKKTVTTKVDDTQFCTREMIYNSQYYDTGYFPEQSSQLCADKTLVQNFQDKMKGMKDVYRREPRYEYTALADESFLHDRLEMDRKLQRDSDRSMSTIRCQYYLRGSNRYVFLRHLPDMGSRLDKNWFLVRDSTTKTERLLTMTPMAEMCPIKYTSDTRQVLLDLFLALQHPYIYPVLDIDRKIVMEQEYVLAVLPFNDEGTLKDVIYQSHCQDDWKEKYHFKGYGLSSSQIQRLGCQILEALLFLKDQRFPPFLHLHSGNIIVQNGVARISGLENSLFGYSSRSHLFIPKRLHDNKEAVEVICFGHLLFEMATGYELTASHPSEKNYMDVENKPLVVDVLKFIFEQGRYHYPSLQQVASLDFFRHIDLRELRSLMHGPSIKAKLSPAARSLLKEVKRQQRSRRQSKRSQSMHAIETESTVDGRDSRSSGTSSRSSRKKKKRSSLTSTETTPDETSSTLLHTMPLSSIEGSLTAAPSVPESLDYYTPPTTPQTAPRTPSIPPEHTRTHALLLQEIQGGVRLKKARERRDVDV